MNIGDPVNTGTRRYHAPRRAAAAAQTREAILYAAKHQFEEHGWAVTTVAAVAAAAAVSPKTIQALFGTKAALLAAAVDYAIAGDVAEVPINARESARSVESAPDAVTMLDRHASHVAAINARSAGLAWVVESAVGSSELVTGLWEQMTANRLFGARWAATTLLTKPGHRPGLTLEQAERDFVIAMDWGTYRTLTGELGLTPGQVHDWIRSYYQRMFLSQAPAS
ncbi:MAG TPA: TetR family transcriptional regulator [Streptosporangiaceae bacterium]